MQIYRINFRKRVNQIEPQCIFFVSTMRRRALQPDGARVLLGAIIIKNGKLFAATRFGHFIFKIQNNIIEERPANVYSWASYRLQDGTVPTHARNRIFVCCAPKRLASRQNWWRVFRSWFISLLWEVRNSTCHGRRAIDLPDTHLSWETWDCSHAP